MRATSCTATMSCVPQPVARDPVFLMTLVSGVHQRKVGVLGIVVLAIRSTQRGRNVVGLMSRCVCLCMRECERPPWGQIVPGLHMYTQVHAHRTTALQVISSPAMLGSLNNQTTSERQTCLRALAGTQAVRVHSGSEEEP